MSAWREEAVSAHQDFTPSVGVGADCPAPTQVVGIIELVPLVQPKTAGVFHSTQNEPGLQATGDSGEERQQLRIGPHSG